MKIIAFDDDAELLFDSSKPTEETLKKELEAVCEQILSHGGTSFKNAISAALDCIKEEDEGFTHIVLLTDGDDIHFSTDPERNPQLKRLRDTPRVFFHSVAICAEGGYQCLTQIKEQVRYGTYQQIDTANVDRLMGGVFGLMCELLDVQCELQVRVGGQIVLTDSKVALRSSNPARVLVPAIAADATDIEAVLVVDDSRGNQTTLTKSITLKDTMAEIDPICSAEYGAYIQSEASREASRVMLNGDFEGAIEIIKRAIKKIEDDIDHPTATAGSLAALQNLLDSTRTAFENRYSARDEHISTHELSARMASDASTARGNSVGGLGMENLSVRTLSELQTNLMAL